MGKVISIHSSRGGTGKSLISVNLAAFYASRGKNMFLCDLDFRAPSLSTVLRIGEFTPLQYIEYWMNDFLNGDCSIKDVIMDLTDRYGFKGKFLVGLANPSIGAMRQMASQSRKWEMEALRKLLAIKPKLFNEMHVDYAIYDTSPGIQYSSVNAVVSSDVSIVVTTLDLLDIEGTRRMISELYDAFGRKSLILLNKVPVEYIASEEARKKLSEHLRSEIPRPILGIIPCYCDVLRSSRISIFVEEKPDHPFSKDIYEIAEKLEET